MCFQKIMKVLFIRVIKIYKSHWTVPFWTDAE